MNSPRLPELGYVEEKSIILQTRWAEARLDRRVAHVGELVRLPVDVLVVRTTGAALDVKRLTTSLPLVASLAQPRGNVAWLTIMQADLSAKRHSSCSGRQCPSSYMSER